MKTNTWRTVPFAKIKTKIENKFGNDFSESLFLYSLSAMIIIYAIMCASFKSHFAVIDYIDKIRYVAALAVLIKIYFLSNYDLKQLTLLSVLYIYIFFNSIQAYDPTLFFSAVMVFGAKNINYKKICKYVFFTTLISTLSVFLMYSLGVLNDVLVPRGTGFRHSFGFSHPNATGLYILCCVSSFVQYCNKKVKLWHCAVILAISVLMYMTANSRAAFMTILLIIASIPFMSKLNANNGKLCKYAGMLSVILIYTAAILFMIFYNSENSFMQLSDKLFSLRLSLSHEAYNFYRLSLFGNPLPIKDGLFTIDCMQVRIALTYGLPTLLLSCAVFLQIQNRASKHNCGYIAIMCLVLLIYSLMETFPYNAVFNVTLFAVCARLE